MGHEEHESTREPFKYGKFVSQLQPDIKTTIRLFERIKPKICRQRMYMIFNQIYSNEEMLPKYTFTFTHTHTLADIHI